MMMGFSVDSFSSKSSSSVDSTSAASSIKSTVKGWTGVSESAKKHSAELAGLILGGSVSDEIKQRVKSDITDLKSTLDTLKLSSQKPDSTLASFLETKKEIDQALSDIKKRVNAQAKPGEKLDAQTSLVRSAEKLALTKLEAAFKEIKDVQGGALIRGDKVKLETEIRKLDGATSTAAFLGSAGSCMNSLTTLNEAITVLGSKETTESVRDDFVVKFKNRFYSILAGDMSPSAIATTWQDIHVVLEDNADLKAIANPGNFYTDMAAKLNDKSGGIKSDITNLIADHKLHDAESLAKDLDLAVAVVTGMGIAGVNIAVATTANTNVQVAIAEYRLDQCLQKLEEELEDPPLIIEQIIANPEKMLGILQDQKTELESLMGQVKSLVTPPVSSVESLDEEETLASRSDSSRANLSDLLSYAQKLSDVEAATKDLSSVLVDSKKQNCDIVDQVLARAKGLTHEIAASSGGSEGSSDVSVMSAITEDITLTVRQSHLEEQIEELTQLSKALHLAEGLKNEVKTLQTGSVSDRVVHLTRLSYTNQVFSGGKPTTPSESIIHDAQTQLDRAKATVVKEGVATIQSHFAIKSWGIMTSKVEMSDHRADEIKLAGELKSQLSDRLDEVTLQKIKGLETSLKTELAKQIQTEIDKPSITPKRLLELHRFCERAGDFGVYSLATVSGALATRSADSAARLAQLTDQVTQDIGRPAMSTLLETIKSEVETLKEATPNQSALTRILGGVAGSLVSSLVDLDGLGNVTLIGDPKQQIQQAATLLQSLTTLAKVLGQSTSWPTNKMIGPIKTKLTDIVTGEINTQKTGINALDFQTLSQRKDAIESMLASFDIEGIKGTSIKTEVTRLIGDAKKEINQAQFEVAGRLVSECLADEKRPINKAELKKYLDFFNSMTEDSLPAAKWTADVNIDRSSVTFEVHCVGFKIHLSELLVPNTDGFVAGDLTDITKDFADGNIGDVVKKLGGLVMPGDNDRTDAALTVFVDAFLSAGDLSPKDAINVAAAILKFNGVDPGGVLDVLKGAFTAQSWDQLNHILNPEDQVTQLAEQFKAIDALKLPDAFRRELRTELWAMANDQIGLPALNSDPTVALTPAEIGSAKTLVSIDDISGAMETYANKVATRQSAQLGKALTEAFQAVSTTPMPDLTALKGAIEARDDLILPEDGTVNGSFTKVLTDLLTDSTTGLLNKNPLTIRDLSIAHAMIQASQPQLDGLIKTELLPKIVTLCGTPDVWDGATVDTLNAFDKLSEAYGGYPKPGSPEKMSVTFKAARAALIDKWGEGFKADVTKAQADFEKIRGGTIGVSGIFSVPKNVSRWQMDPSQASGIKTVLANWQAFQEAAGRAAFSDSKEVKALLPAIGYLKVADTNLGKADHIRTAINLAERTYPIPLTRKETESLIAVLKENPVGTENDKIPADARTQMVGKIQCYFDKKNMESVAGYLCKKISDNPMLRLTLTFGKVVEKLVTIDQMAKDARDCGVLDYAAYNTVSVALGTGVIDAQAKYGELKALAGGSLSGLVPAKDTSEAGKVLVDNAVRSMVEDARTRIATFQTSGVISDFSALLNEIPQKQNDHDKARERVFETVKPEISRALADVVQRDATALSGIDSAELLGTAEAIKTAFDAARGAGVDFTSATANSDRIFTVKITEFFGTTTPTTVDIQAGDLTALTDKLALLIELDTLGSSVAFAKDAAETRLNTATLLHHVHNENYADLAASPKLTVNLNKTENELYQEALDDSEYVVGANKPLNQVIAEKAFNIPHNDPKAQSALVVMTKMLSLNEGNAIGVGLTAAELTNKIRDYVTQAVDTTALTAPQTQDALTKMNDLLSAIGDSNVVQGLHYTVKTSITTIVTELLNRAATEGAAANDDSWVDCKAQINTLKNKLGVGGATEFGGITEARFVEVDNAILDGNQRQIRDDITAFSGLADGTLTPAEIKGKLVTHTLLTRTQTNGTAAQKYELKAAINTQLRAVDVADGNLTGQATVLADVLEAVISAYPRVNLAYITHIKTAIAVKFEKKLDLRGLNDATEDDVNAAKKLVEARIAKRVAANKFAQLMSLGETLEAIPVTLVDVTHETVVIRPGHRGAALVMNKISTLIAEFPYPGTALGLASLAQLVRISGGNEETFGTQLDQFITGTPTENCQKLVDVMTAIGDAHLAALPGSIKQILANKAAELAGDVVIGADAGLNASLISLMDQLGQMSDPVITLQAKRAVLHAVLKSIPVKAVGNPGEMVSQVQNINLLHTLWTQSDDPNPAPVLAEGISTRLVTEMKTQLDNYLDTKPGELGELLTAADDLPNPGACGMRIEIIKHLSAKALGGILTPEVDASTKANLIKDVAFVGIRGAEIMDHLKTIVVAALPEDGVVATTDQLIILAHALRLSGGAEITTGPVFNVGSFNSLLGAHLAALPRNPDKMAVLAALNPDRGTRALSENVQRRILSAMTVVLVGAVDDVDVTRVNLDSIKHFAGVQDTAEYESIDWKIKVREFVPGDGSPIALAGLNAAVKKLIEDKPAGLLGDSPAIASILTRLKHVTVPPIDAGVFGAWITENVHELEALPGKAVQLAGVAGDITDLSSNFQTKVLAQMTAYCGRPLYLARIAQLDKVLRGVGNESTATTGLVAAMKNHVETIFETALNQAIGGDMGALIQGGLVAFDAPTRLIEALSAGDHLDGIKTILNTKKVELKAAFQFNVIRQVNGMGVGTEVYENLQFAASIGDRFQDGIEGTIGDGLEDLGLGAIDGLNVGDDYRVTCESVKVRLAQMIEIKGAVDSIPDVDEHSDPQGISVQLGELMNVLDHPLVTAKLDAIRNLAQGKALSVSIPLMAHVIRLHSGIEMDAAYAQVVNTMFPADSLGFLRRLAEQEPNSLQNWPAGVLAVLGAKVAEIADSLIAESLNEIYGLALLEQHLIIEELGNIRPTLGDVVLADRRTVEACLSEILD